jgi:hypothetical protein
LEQPLIEPNEESKMPFKLERSPQEDRMLADEVLPFVKMN